MVIIIVYILGGLVIGFITGLIISVYRYPVWEVRKMIREFQNKEENMGEWIHEKKLADHHDKIIVKPSCEVLYSYTFLDLSKGSYLLKMPEFNRYFSFAFLNINTDVLAYLTNRDAVKGQPLEAILTNKKETYSGRRVIRLDAKICWVIGRFGVDSKMDILTTNGIQQKIELTPYSNH